MPSPTDNLVGEHVIVVEEELPETNHAVHAIFFIAAFFFQCLATLSDIFNPAVAAVRRGLGRLWNYFYLRAAIGEEAAIMPSSPLTFIITALLAFAGIRSQGQPGFPFQTHPQAIMVSVTSLLVYGFASAAELVISVASLDPTSVYAIIARFGKIGSLCILVASLASLFYS